MLDILLGITITIFIIILIHSSVFYLIFTFIC